jgi:hypothetical protein
MPGNIKGVVRVRMTFFVCADPLFELLLPYIAPRAYRVADNSYVKLCHFAKRRTKHKRAPKQRVEDISAKFETDQEKIKWRDSKNQQAEVGKYDYLSLLRLEMLDVRLEINPRQFWSIAEMDQPASSSEARLKWHLH